ncbi:MAG: hypothetical protein N838_11845 [Thiohalocapsa sp. PB-PSB1]|nr:MAG: hypothetical protein N838_11845 [Thiohalocapsa sp. PB-PSB1]
MMLKMMKRATVHDSLRSASLALLLGLCTFGLPVAAVETLCARVVIEIAQEVTFERQAFEARMVINNGLDALAIDDVDIDVAFTDENDEPVLASSDPDNAEAAFFIRVDGMTGIDAIDGTGTIAPATSADIRWLIVPSPGAGGSSPSGKLHYVGATLRYTLNGEEKLVTVSPDYIYVKPMPLLVLDYFLPIDVFADDAFTPQLEPPEPFPLGIRLANIGQGVAYDQRIDSAQPRIVENELGLLIDFRITGSSVDDLAHGDHVVGRVRLLRGRAVPCRRAGWRADLAHRRRAHPHSGARGAGGPAWARRYHGLPRRGRRQPDRL